MQKITESMTFEHIEQVAEKIKQLFILSGAFRHALGDDEDGEGNAFSGEEIALDKNQIKAEASGVITQIEKDLDAQQERIDGAWTGL